MSKEFELYCKFCKHRMVLDDVDFNFDGNKDNHFICTNCDARAVEQIRDGKSVKIEWIGGECANE